MSKPSLLIQRIERRFCSGNTEELAFSDGVNVLVGPPNVGKTRWLEALDFLLGAPSSDPYDEIEGLEDIYDAITGYFRVGDEEVVLERRWREVGLKTQIICNGEPLQAKDMQHFLQEKLGLPQVHFPKGNPYSGQTWPELSFRTLLRHIFRQQRFWSGLVDKQPEGEQHAALLQFLGFADKIFTPEYGELVKTTRALERLRAERDAYQASLQRVAQDILTDEDLAKNRTITIGTVQHARERLQREIGTLQQRRQTTLQNAQASRKLGAEGGAVEKMGAYRARLLDELEQVEIRLQSVNGRIAELDRYKNNLDAERDKFERAADASELLADMRITHCPSCDQEVRDVSSDENICFLCHQKTEPRHDTSDAGSRRLNFERQRLSVELEEAGDLLRVLKEEQTELSGTKRKAHEELRAINVQLETHRSAVSAIANEEISFLDVAVGQLVERQRQLDRLAVAADSAQSYQSDIQTLQQQHDRLKGVVDRGLSGLDFSEGEGRLQDGMNEYIELVRAQKPHIWKHRPITVSITQQSARFFVGSKRWDKVLGGTDSLYFLMAYQYGLLSLYQWEETRYPGLSIIDLPGEFVGEDVRGLENFIVQPFIELLERDEMDGAQVIITGASFEGLKGVERVELTHVHTS